MRVILSRKGFDTSTGGFASPIFNNKLISLPIPECDSDVYYRKLCFDSHYNYLDVILDLKKGFNDREAHLDPDIRKSVLKRDAGWKGIFGQSKAAGAELKIVEKNDLFLFFGLFQNVVREGGKFRYSKSDKVHINGQHIIFGYLQVGEIIDLSVPENRVPLWASKHPHIRQKEKYGKNNTLFIANDVLSFDKKKQGWGCLRYHDDLRLTKESETMSFWELPGFFDKEEHSFSKSFHLKRKEKLSNGNILMERFGQSQEVFISSSQEVINWAKKLLTSCSIDE